MALEAVVFDVGETLVDEERWWRELCERSGLRPHVVWAALGVTIERGEEHHALWGHLGLERPAGWWQSLTYDDASLYPDALECLEAVRAMGLRVGIVGNQSAALERWAHDAAIFYTFEALGVLDKVHRPFFDAIHRGGLRSDNRPMLAEWLQRQGIDPKKFDDTMKSFGVQSKMRRAAQLTADYKIDGTPAMAVHGRYTVSTEQGRTREGMFETVDFLTDTVRKHK